MSAFPRNALMTAIDLISLYGEGAAEVAMARIDAQIASPGTGQGAGLAPGEALDHWRKVHSLLASGYLEEFVTRGS